MFQKKVVVTNFTRKKQCLCDVTTFICFTSDLLHSVPQSAEIEAKEIDLQEKKVLIVLQFNLPLGNLIRVIFCYSNFSRYGLFVKNDQYKILDLIVYNLLGFWNFDFWLYGRLAFWFLGICRSYMCTSSCNRSFQMTQPQGKSEELEWGFWRTLGNSPHPSISKGSYAIEENDNTLAELKSF